MSLKSILTFTYRYLSAFSKQKLLRLIDILRKEYVDLEVKYKLLEDENHHLKSEQIKNKIQGVNKRVNQPSSKQPEWDSKGVGNDGKGKKKGRGHKGRKGAGNTAKDLIVTDIESAKVEICDNCGADLSGQNPIKSENTRIIVDIPELPIALKVIEVKQEKKYCSNCKQVVTASSELALPQADIGINTTISLVYLWVALCLPFTRIAEYFNNFFGQKISTSGLSNHVIAVSKIMKAVYNEILENVKSAVILHADETGWRVSGDNWWLWAFGTNNTVFYTIDKSRGSDVVRKVLGEIFFGVLVVDGWKAYLSLECKQQSCMAHLLRKIRKLHETFPELSSVYKYYIKFRKILRDGEALQLKRVELSEHIFERRHAKLHARLDELLLWKNPNDILKDIIKKTELQRPRILTFIEHPSVPCHNNFAEYLIRIGVLKRKVSFGSKSAEGADAYAILLSIHKTCKLRKIPFTDFMKSSLKHYIRTGKPMLLQEYQDANLDENLAA